MDLWSMAVIFTLAFLGLASIVFLLVFVVVAYHNMITITTGPYPGGKTLLEALKAKKKNEPFP
jgi:hypothetical protein